MSGPGVGYPKDQREKAKAGGFGLITLDIDGKYARRDGVTYQGFIRTPGEFAAAWAFLHRMLAEWGKRNTKPKAKKAARKPRKRTA